MEAVLRTSLQNMLARVIILAYEPDQAAAVAKQLICSENKTLKRALKRGKTKLTELDNTKSAYCNNDERSLGLPLSPLALVGCRMTTGPSGYGTHVDRQTDRQHFGYNDARV